MIRKIVSVVVGALFLAMSYVSINAQLTYAVSCPSGSLNSEATSLGGCNIPKEEEGGGGSIWTTVQTIINVILGVLGVVAVVMIILGGVQYMTSAGDASKLAKAKNTILYAIVGLVVALMAYAIVNFVLNNVFGGESS